MSYETKNAGHGPWSLLREPQWTTTDGYKGLTFSVRADLPKTFRELQLEFPYPKKKPGHPVPEKQRILPQVRHLFRPSAREALQAIRKTLEGHPSGFAESLQLLADLEAHELTSSPFAETDAE